MSWRSGLRVWRIALLRASRGVAGRGIARMFLRSRGRTIRTAGTAGAYVTGQAARFRARSFESAIAARNINSTASTLGLFRDRSSDPSDRPTDRLYLAPRGRAPL